MSDIATLGLRIDSSQAATATKELDKLAVVGKRAEASFDAIQRAAAMGSPAAKGYAKALGEAHGITERLTSAQVKVIRTLENLIASTQMAEEGQFAYNTLRSAGTTADSEAGGVILGLTAAYAQLRNEQLAAAEAVKQEGAAFKSSFEGRVGITDAVRKSAAESARVFDQEFKRIESIATARARQAGVNFSNSFNASMGIGGAPATSKGATVSALQEQSAKLDMIDTARAKHIAEVTQRQIGQAYGIDQVRKSAKDSYSAFAELGAIQDKTERSSSNLANTLTRRFVLGYAVSQVRGLISAVAGLNTELAQTGYLGRLTGLGTGGFQGLQQTAGNGGIGGAALASAMTAFNQQIPLAKAGIGDLGQLLRANRVTVTDTSDAFFKVADLVKNAKDDTARLSILQQAGLPATRQWSEYMGQGSEALRKAIADAPKLGNAQIEQAERLERRFNELWTNVTTWGKQALVNIADSYDNSFLKWALNGAPKSPLYRGKQMSQSDADSFYGATGADRTRGKSGDMTGSATRDWATEKAIAQARNAVAQVRVSLLGKTPTAKSIAAAKAEKAKTKAANDDRDERVLQRAA